MGGERCSLLANVDGAVDGVREVGECVGRAGFMLGISCECHARMAGENTIHKSHHLARSVRVMDL